jgi:ferric-dicitrate binding protein FerR (iron transport regulator)
VLLLFGYCGLIILNAPKNEEEIVTIHTDGKTDTTFRLPDSSVVWLNKNSEIAYKPHNFLIKQRRVFLKKGEAYFEVKRDTSSKFSVRSNKMSVNVLGTGFNVYNDEKQCRLQVMVSHGLVEVARLNKRLSYLKRGESINVNTRTGKFDKKYFNPAYAAAWRNNEIFLNKVSFQILSQVFFSLYKINLISTDKLSKKYTYTLVINKKDDFQASLSVITSIHQNNFKQDGNTIIIY